MAKFIHSIHKPFIFITLMFASAKASACDICGSGLRDASFSMGYLQTIPSHFLGVWGNSLGFKTQTGFSNGTQFTVTDKILQSGIIFNQQVNKKFQINYRMGIQQISRKNENNENATNTYSGLSDLNIALNYTLFDNRKFNLGKTKQLAIASAQMKIPNGHYQLRDSFKRLLPMNLQPGNGSYSLGAQALYGTFYQGWSWNIQASVLHNFENELKYRQGDNGMLRTGIGKSFTAGKSNFLPMIGYQFQTFSPDQSYGEFVTTTGGSIQAVFLQFEWVRKNLYGRFQANILVNQNFPEFSPQSSTPYILTVGWLINQNSEDIKSFD